jgi:NDP-sugar pyrophosphorylase family protein
MGLTIDSAMLLAAGLGTRLRPLTLTTPKPLLPLDGCLLIDHQLAYLAAGGVHKVAINLHHLGNMIRDHVGDGKGSGLEILYSEESEILGTGGGIKKAARFFGRRSFITLNADALLACDLGKLAAAHEANGCDVTMVLAPLPEGTGYTPVEVGGGEVKGFGSGSHFFAGLSVLGPAIFDALPPSGKAACLVRDGFQVMLERKGKIGAFIYDGYFNDLGTPERYEAARRDIADGGFELIRP